ncbi:hypothetical protein GCM10009541_26880 [Micromonospora gifhornensis]|uniref:Histidine kinase-, DNA gyrase B-, and HSP90-like ATPase n=1 Tax=Micromonospora gifhornensis TaxID=84594 RepID=A0ABQ4ILB5_9ACTN|nr:hypothetical protein [Micromonospora gifhornensis]GIJ18701.1 hypothetical protein Vgi01_53850 [Micromonospora gifhornensis]
MTDLRIGSRLNATTWAAALTRLRPGPLRGRRLLIDLSDLGFADFVTLGYLLVFVRAAAAAGADCKVRLPSADALPSGTPADPLAAQRIVKRHNCRRYLEQAGVVEVLGEHLDEQVVAGDGTSTDADGEVLTAPPTSERPHRYRRILRYQWLPSESLRDITLVTRPTATERSLRELGLRPETAAAVTRGILLELFENAERHSGAKEVLIGGVIVDPETYGQRATDFDESLEGFAQHAAAAQSPMIRLVVADTGRGIDGGVSVVDTRTGAQGAARGMWKVARVVRAFQGALLVTSQGQASGRVYRGTTQKIAARRPAIVPGTLIECNILADPGDSALAGAGELRTPAAKPDDEPAATNCLAVRLYSSLGLNEKGRNDIRGKLANDAHLVVAVNAPDDGHGAHDVEIGRAAFQVIDIVAGFRGHRAAILAFPSVNRPLMAVAMEYVNAEYDDRVASGEDVPPPVLVLAPDNRHYWVGGTLAQRQVLIRLSTAGEPPPLTELSPDESSAVDDLARHTALIVIDGARVRLRTSPRSAVRAMATWVGERIAAAIEDPPENRGEGTAAGENVRRGRFLTPSLRRTNRWFDLDGVLSELDLRALVGITLAARAEECLPPSDENGPLVVLRLPHTPTEVAAAVARTVAAQGNYDFLRDVPHTDEQPRVLLVADVVSSGNSVASVVAEVRDLGINPVAVTTIVDARTPDEPGIDLPVAALAVVDVGLPADDDGPTQPIDPVLRSPEHGGRPLPATVIDQDQYVETMQRNAAARLGHIERPADRHYTAYVDPTLLFRERRWTDTVFGCLVPEIERRHREAFGETSARVTILFPEGTADDLSVTADQMRRALPATMRAEVASVPRAAHTANWQLPGSAALPTVEHALILDSGASSGRTVQQLVGLAADKGAVTITVILLINGLGDSDAVNLQRIARVRRSDESSPRERAALRIYYVARTAMSNLRSSHCGICALRRRYAELTLYAPVPEPLATHRGWLLKLLEARTKQQLFEEQAADLFGADVTQRECVAYLRWRLRLRDADVNTRRRARIVERLQEAASNGEYRDALIRLLVAEPQWLSSAPLSFPRCRALIVDMAAAMLVGEAALLIGARLRVQAVILLTRAAPERFAAELVRIMRTNRDDGLVVPQVMLEVLQLMSARRTGAPFPRMRVAQQLTDALGRLLDDLRDKNEAPGIRSSYVNVPLVRYLLSHTRRPLHAPPPGKQEAWSQIRHEIAYVAHDFSTPMWLAKSTVEFVIATGRLPRNHEAIAEAWNHCQNFLLEVILPNAAMLRDILVSRSAERDLSQEEIPLWERTLSDDGPKFVDETTVRVDNFVGKIKSGLVPSKEEAANLLPDLLWWLRFALDGDKSVLRRFVARGPVDALPAAREFFGDRGDVLVDRLVPAEQRGAYRVFCTDRLLEQVLLDIRHNADTTHRVAGVPQTFQVELEYRQERLLITVRNTGSAPHSGGSGKGLETLRHRLERFGGTLHEAKFEPPWTYAVTVELDRWRMPT